MGYYSNNSSNLQSVTYSQLLENGWSYLLYAGNQNIKEDVRYNGETLNNNANKRYLYADFADDSTNVNLGYSDVSKDAYMGYSLDQMPDEGDITSKDFFISYNKFFLDDRSIKLNLSYDVNVRSYNESNQEGLFLTDYISVDDGRTSLPPYYTYTLPTDYSEKTKFEKTNVFLSKDIDYDKNNILVATNFKNKKYDTKDRDVSIFTSDTQTNVIFTPQPTLVPVTTTSTTNQEIGQYNDFDEENVFSLMVEDSYHLRDNLFLIGNAKVDRYERSGFMYDSTEKMYRVGAIYMPTQNLGFKTFYTKTYVPPTFYNIDYAYNQTPALNTQKLDYFTVEGVYTLDNNEFRVQHYRIKLDDLIYFTPVGFINIDKTINNKGFVFDYTYKLNDKGKITFNYFITQLDEEVNSSDKGGYAKYMNSYGRFDYFTSLIYRNGYEYSDNYGSVSADDTYDVSVGSTYNFTKNFSVSLKGENLLNEGTKTLYTNYSDLSSFTLEDSQRKVTLSLKWMF